MSSKNKVLIALAFLSLLTGVVDQYFYPNHELPPTAIAFMMVAVFLIFLWYRLDTAQTGYKRSPWLNVAVVGLNIVALPYYFFRSRGAKRGFIATGLFLLAHVASVVLTFSGSYLTYYVLQS